MAVQTRTQRSGMVVPGTVQHHDQALVAGPVLEPLLQKTFERFCVEFFLERTDQLASAGIHGAKAGNRLARGCMQQDGIFRFRGHPLPAPAASVAAWVSARSLNLLVPVNRRE